MTERRTARGKIVDSYRPPLTEFTYWPEKNSTTNEDGFVTVAPSGARMEWFKAEPDAVAYVATENAKWRAP
jgi:hypothetical protein